MIVRPLLALAAALALCASAAVAAPTPGKLALELNALQPATDACRATFLATNDLGATLAKATFELALFGKDGTISRVLTAEFNGLTEGKTKVLQFDLKGIQCDGISRILVNDVTTCTGEGIAAGACLAGLTTSTKTAITFGV
jgi:hypothetical protein